MPDSVVGRVYDEQAEMYGGFADDRFAWKYLERPAFDRYVSDHYRPDTRLLDIGCGSGVVARHFIDHGVRPGNVIGIDVSTRQLEQARTATPGASFLHASAADFNLPPESIDLVVSNTMLHHLDNEQLEQMLERVYDVLMPDGSYFFVEIDPDHNIAGRDPNNTNRWTPVTTPWGTEVPFFNRDPADLTDLLDRQGFDKQAGWLLKVASEGAVDPDEFARYANRPSRFAGRYQKVPWLAKIARQCDVVVPSFERSPLEHLQRQLATRYYAAWRAQSASTLPEIFTDDATYDEKPGEKEPIRGLPAILEYWQANPVAQANVALTDEIIGFSRDGECIWTEFHASFDNRGQHRKLEGILGLIVDEASGKISRLVEHFKAQSVPI